MYGGMLNILRGLLVGQLSTVHPSALKINEMTRVLQLYLIALF